MARPSTLDFFEDADFEALAILLADGATREQIGEAFGGADKSTITRWKKDERVQKWWAKARRERANEMLSLTDSQLLGKLRAGRMSVDQLLKVRQAFAVEGEDSDAADSAAAVLAALMERAHGNPSLARELRQVMDATE